MTLLKQEFVIKLMSIIYAYTSKRSKLRIIIIVNSKKLVNFFIGSDTKNKKKYYKNKQLVYPVST